MSELPPNIFQHAICSIMEPGWSRMEQKFRPLVRPSSELVEVQVLCGIALRLTRMAIAGDLLARKGLDEEGHVLQRPAFESIINLSFIFYSGPRAAAKPGKPPQKSTIELCKQFCAYADVAYWRLAKRNPARIRETFKNRRGLSDSDCDELLAENLRLSQEASIIHECGKSRWHKMDLRSMVEVVLNDPPPFVDSKLLKSTFDDLDSSNSAVHADALSLRTQYNDHGTDLLKLVYKNDAIRGEIVAALTLSAWRAIGWYFNDLEWVNMMINEELYREFRLRHDAEAKKLTRFILIGGSSREFPGMPMKTFVSLRRTT